jgi:hypothetical protein
MSVLLRFLVYSRSAVWLVVGLSSFCCGFWFPSSCRGSWLIFVLLWLLVHLRSAVWLLVHRRPAVWFLVCFRLAVASGSHFAAVVSGFRCVMAPGSSSSLWLLVLVQLRLLVHFCSAVASGPCSSCCGFWSIFVLLRGSWFIFVLLWLLVSMLLRLLVSVLPWLLGSLLLWLLVSHRSAVWLLVFFLPCGFWFILVLLWLRFCSIFVLLRLPFSVLLRGF